MDDQFQPEPSVPTGQPAAAYQKLGRKTYWLFVLDHIGVSLFFLFLTIVVIVLEIVFGNQAAVTPYDYIFNYVILAGFLLFVLAALVGILVAKLEYSKFQIMLDTDSFKIRRGVLTAEYVSIPYRRIEAVDVRQSFLYQILGVSRITLELTIDSEPESDRKPDSNDEVLPAIDTHLALELQTELTNRSNVQKMTVQNVGPQIS